MRQRLLDFIVKMAAHHRWTVLIVTVLLTLVLGYGAEQLELDTRWHAILPETLPAVQEFKKVESSYVQPSGEIVVIQGGPIEELERISDEVAATLEAELGCDLDWSQEQCREAGLYARYVYASAPLDWLEANALALAKPYDVERATRLMADPRLGPWLAHFNDDLEAEYTDGEGVANNERQVVAALDAVLTFATALDVAADGEVNETATDRAVRDLVVGSPYQLSLDGGMSLVSVAPAIDTLDATVYTLVDKRVEEVLAPLVQKYPDFTIERTGMLAVGRAEMDSVGPQTLAISLLAMVFVFFLLVWNFRSWKTPLQALLPIVIGIVWAMGIIGFVLGSLNLMTSMIAVVLLGLGIDFSIHVANRFHEEIVAGLSTEMALQRAVGETGQAVITGAVTSAVAFFALMVAETKGVSEFGFCAGAGVLASLAAVLWILPALLARSADRKRARGKLPTVGRDFRFLGRLAVASGRARWLVIGLFAIAVGLGGWAGTKIDWEWNFMELEPEGLRCIELQSEIVDRFRFSTQPANLTVPTIEQSRATRQALRQRKMVGAVDDISSWVSRPDFADNLPHIRALREALRAGPPEDDELLAMTEPERTAQLTEELDRLWANVVEIQALSLIGGQDRVVDKAVQLVGTRDDRDAGPLRRLADRFEVGRIDPTTVQTFSARFEQQAHRRATTMASVEEPVALADVPDRYRELYVSGDVPGFLMTILPSEDLFERAPLERFQDQVTQVSEAVTGMPLMMLMLNLETMREGKLAFLLALAVILLVLLVDFRRPLMSMLAFLPLVCALALLLGTMFLLGEKLHYLNVIALPVIVGIGVDNGVHFLHRFAAAGPGGMERATTSVGRAILMSSLTTMVAFGSLMAYLMRGMADLGMVLFVGMGFCLLTTFTLLPATAQLFARHIHREAKP
jgi:uncharacterized protein